MSFKLKLSGNREIVLPTLPTVEERIAYVEKILAEYPNEFIYTLPENKNQISHGDIVEYRLDTLATYILTCKEVKRNKEYPVMSNYKRKKIKKNEVLLDCIEQFDKNSIKNNIKPFK